MATAEITVRGAGIFGLSVAFECARRGAQVRVIDPGGAGAGSSGGVVGALAPHVPENWNEKKAFQLDSLLMSQAFWAEVMAVSGQDPGYARCGRLQPLANTRAVELARARETSAQALWQGQAVWQVVAAPEAGDWAPPSPTGFLVHDTLSARLHPARACAALAAAVSALGGEVVPEGPDRGTVIWATGWRGLLDLSDALGQPVGNGVKGQAALLQLDRSTAPQLFVDGVHFVPHADGTLAIGSTSERAFEDPGLVDGQLEELLDKARVLVPQIAEAPVLTRWAGVRPRAKSRAPMLGHWPDRAGHFIANGGFKIGFGMAPGVAQVMADLVLEGRDEIPEGFRVEASL